jgi:DNA uptake protein ComE-like DNA-binding protein
MLRRSVLTTIVLALVWTGSVAAQMKDAPKAAPKSTRLTLDINSAPENEMVSLGIDRVVAKKIVEGRPYRSKRDLVTRQLLTAEQYDKFKNLLVAKRAAKK